MSEYRKEISKVVYNNRYGYAIAFYPPNPHMRDTSLEIMERAKRINLPSVRKIKPEPTRVWKMRETPSDFIKRKNMERDIEVLHDTCVKAKDLFKKARDYDYNRHEMLFPQYKNAFHSRNVDDVIHDVNEVYEKNLERAKSEAPCELHKPLIVDIHDNSEHKISKRRNDAIHEIQVYRESINKMLKRIEDLSNAFNEKEDDDNNKEEL
jgi:hypothetical protein